MNSVLYAHLPGQNIILFYEIIEADFTAASEIADFC
jgi:hypothetical protein